MSLKKVFACAVVVSAGIAFTARVKAEDIGVAPAGVLPVIEKFIATQSTKRAPPAISISIGRNGALVFAAGIGEAAPGQTASANTIYKIGSITKQFTAAAVLRMVELGATQGAGEAPISLDTPIANLLQGPDAWKADGAPPITVKNLLSMTSSLPNFTRRPPKHLDPWGAMPAHRLLGELKGLQPSSFPGSYEYSNTSYFLLSEILATLQVSSGVRSYHSVLQQEIFDKLGLHDTGFASAAAGGRTAKPHFNRKPAFNMPDWLQGSADVSSTVIDLHKWNTALMQGRLLSPQMRAAMFSDAARVDVWTYYGMGWFVRHKEGRDDFYHSGSVPGYTAINHIDAASDQDWTSVSILTNSDGIDGLDQLAVDLAVLARTP